MARQQKGRPPREGEAMVRTSLVLPREVLDGLRASGKGVSEEIRDRLVTSLLDSARPAETQMLVAEIVQLADEVRRDFGTEWHTDLNAYKALVAAIVDQLATKEPKEVSGAVPALFGRANQDDSPEVIGRALARKYRREKQKIEASRTEYRTYIKQMKGQGNDQ
jgi:hypothetical protein